MKLNHKQFLTPDEAANVQSMRNRMTSLLDTKHMDQSEKAAKYRDLLTRLRNYYRDIDVPATVRVLPEPEPPLIPHYKVGKKAILFKEVTTNAANELVLSGERIPGSDYQDVYNYVYMQRKNKPQGVEQFLTHLERVGDDRIASKIKDIANTPSTLRPELHAQALKMSGKKKEEEEEELADDYSTPMAPGNKRTPLAIQRKSTRLRQQRGTGEKRLYIKLWKL